MIFQSVLALILSQVALAHQVPLFTVKQILTPEVHQFIERLRVDENIPGVTVGLVHANGQVEYTAWGAKGEDGTPMTADTSFILASCSKAFLSASMGILMDDFPQGRNVTALPSYLNVFDWSTKVTDLLPGQWELEDKWATQKASVRDILSHVSGMPRHDNALHRWQSPEDVLLNLRNLRTTHELREKWSYNNHMYVVGSHLISTYSGMPYAEFAKERIFAPLGMTSTTYSPSEAARDQGLSQSWASVGRRIPIWFTDDMRDLNAGPGGAISNVVDMTKWLKALLNKGINTDANTTVVPRAVFDAVTTAHAIVDGRPASSSYSISGYGMGWFHESYKGHDFVSHTGGILGFSTLTGFLPADGVGIVVLANADTKAAAVAKITERIIEEAVGLSGLSLNAQSSNPEPRHQIVARSTLALEKYAGRYYNEGYGTLLLCAPTSTSPSPECRQVLDDFATVENLTSTRTLYGSYPAAYSSHIRMQHVEGDNFGLAFTALFPRGYGRDESAFQTWTEGHSDDLVEFVLQENPATNQTEVVSFGLMGTEEEQAARKRSFPQRRKSTPMTAVHTVGCEVASGASPRGRVVGQYVSEGGSDILALALVVMTRIGAE